MAKAATIIATAHLSLDGVYQGPGRADEDRSGGFDLGGWSASRADPELQQTLAGYMSAGWALLAGSRTYRILHESWPGKQPDSPMTKALTQVDKFVVSHDETLDLPWANSTLIAGDAIPKIANLKRERQGALMIFGSGVLVRSLLAHGLIDRLVLMIHSVILGKGYRLFGGVDHECELQLEGEFASPSGVVVLTYRPKASDGG